MRKKVLLDCDPGIDDAIAIITANYFCDLVGITTVNGNVGVDKATANALAVTEIAGIDVEVHQGASRPLTSSTMQATRNHGMTGLGNVTLPSLTRAAASHDAIAYICDMARSVEKMHLLAVGPLTNIALALRRDPCLPRYLDGVTIMGGTTQSGSVTPVAEFNIWADPEAAAIVFRKASPVTMIGLNVTQQILLSTPELDTMKLANTHTSNFAAELLQHSPTAHDAVAAIYVTHHHLFKCSRHTVAIELRGNITRGMTVVDTRSCIRPSDQELQGTSTNVAWDVQADAVSSLIVEAVTHSH